MNQARIAILIDGGFFLKRLPRLVEARHCNSPGRIVACIRRLCRNHIKTMTGDNDSRWHRHVYRIFFYDAEPYEGKAHHLLRQQRKVALRLGKVVREHDWAIRPELTKKLLKSRSLLAALDALPEESKDASMELQLTPQQVDGGSVRLGLRQKGVDMRIGVDITSLALKRQVDTIILVAGDSDFVPAAKPACRTPTTVPTRTRKTVDMARKPKRKKQIETLVHD